MQGAPRPPSGAGSIAEPGPLLRRVTATVRRHSRGSDLAVVVVGGVLAVLAVAACTAAALAALVLVAGSADWMEATFGTLRGRPRRALAVATASLVGLLLAAAAVGRSTAGRSPRGRR